MFFGDLVTVGKYCVNLSHSSNSRLKHKSQVHSCGDAKKYSILPITRTSKGPMKMVRVNECLSYPG